MKKIMMLAILSMFSLAGFTQRFVFVDTEYILDKIPEYKEAQSKLDLLAEDWRKEIDTKTKEIDALYKKFQSEQYLLDESTKMKREEEIIQQEKEVKDLQKKRFGYEGDLFKKRQELVKPIQDKVFDAITTMAESKGYDFVFDKSSSGAGMLFASPKYDRSDDILKALGQ